VVLAMTYLGGKTEDHLAALKVDPSATSSWPAPLSPRISDHRGCPAKEIRRGSTWGDAWVAKLNSSLTTELFGTYFGSTGEEQAQALAVDAAGNVYITGLATSTGLTPTSLGTNPTAFQSGYGGGSQDAFLLELNPTGPLLCTSATSAAPVPTAA